MDVTGSVVHKSFIRSEQSVLSQMMWVALFAALTAIGARIEIPYQPVPYTLQTVFVLLSGAFLGSRNGAMSQILYLLVGGLGVPVFSMGGFGISWLLGPTGGYLLVFPAAAAVVGYLLHTHRGLLWTYMSMAIGTMIIFASGTIQLYAVVFKNWNEAFTAGFLIFSWWDVLKLLAAAMIYHELSKRWAKLPG
jgi:biotin transport system substrate-specific component